MMRGISGLGLVVALASLGGAARAQDAAAGAATYAERCALCHGEALVPNGAAPDLKALRGNQRSHFDTMVMQGTSEMPAWDGVLGAEDLDNLWAYIRAEAG